MKRDSDVLGTLRSIYRPVMWCGLGLALVLATAACGGDDEAGAAGSTSTSTSATPAESPATTAAASLTERGSATTTGAPAGTRELTSAPTGTPAGADATSTPIVMTPEPTSPAGGSPTATRALSQLPVDVTVMDGAIEPARLIARAGAITLEITNNGAAPHTLEIAIAGMILVSPDVAPGTTITWPVRIDTPGEYELYSAIDGAREDGMTAILKVV